MAWMLGGFRADCLKAHLERRFATSEDESVLERSCGGQNQTFHDVASSFKLSFNFQVVKLQFQGFGTFSHHSFNDDMFTQSVQQRCQDSFGLWRWRETLSNPFQ